jgi:hypothetical protein
VERALGGEKMTDKHNYRVVTLADIRPIYEEMRSRVRLIRHKGMAFLEVKARPNAMWARYMVPPEPKDAIELVYHLSQKGAYLDLTSFVIEALAEVYGPQRATWKRVCGAAGTYWTK